MRCLVLPYPSRAVIGCHSKKMKTVNNNNAVATREKFNNYLLIVQKNTVGYGDISVPVFIDFDIVGVHPSVCVLQDVNCPFLIGEISVRCQWR